MQTVERIDVFEEEIPPGKHYMAEMNGTGDTKILWNADKPEEVELAREQFKLAMDKKFTAYRVNKKGEPGEIIREFDPEAERIILVKQMQGG